MAKKSRDKGNRRELQVAARYNAAGVPARKVSRMYRPGEDIRFEGPRGPMLAEVKARADGWKQIRKWLQDVDALHLIADRSEPIVCVREEVWMALLKGNAK